MKCTYSMSGTIGGNGKVVGKIVFYDLRKNTPKTALRTVQRKYPGVERVERTGVLGEWSFTGKDES